MKSLFYLEVFLCLVFATGFSSLRAQTNSAPAAERENPMIAFLTPEQQDKYAKAHAKALADNPALSAEGDNLKEKFASTMSTGTSADKQAFMEKMNEHRQKLREAMLKEDPTLEPVFAEIDKHLSEMKAKQLGQVHSSSDPATGSAGH